MHLFEKIVDLQSFLKKENKSVGFVATMGALHAGHISLIKQSQKECEITICSIFVNPKQFNKQEDLLKYPKTIDEDLEQLKNANCDVVFIPSVEEMYPIKKEKNFDFGILSEVMEAEHRPGHFNGVAIVIERFFEIINPTCAYFGEKDFQQLAVVQSLVKQLKLPTKIVGCPIFREKNGLAMSSRNKRLSEKEKDVAKAIKEGLDLVKKHHKNYSIKEIKEHYTAKIKKHKELSLEYFEIADGHSLKLLNNWYDSDYCVAFVAVNIGTVRLIDNMTIIS